MGYEEIKSHAVENDSTPVRLMEGMDHPYARITRKNGVYVVEYINTLTEEELNKVVNHGLSEVSKEQVETLVMELNNGAVGGRRRRRRSSRRRSKSRRSSRRRQSKSRRNRNSRRSSKTASKGKRRFRR